MFRFPLPPAPPVLQAGIWASALLLSGGCNAASLKAAALHWQVPPPPAVSAAAPVLWVALAAQLQPPTPLRLRSATGNLRLETSRGERFGAPEFLLQWRSVPLAEPLTLRRQVWGPFASY